MPIDDIDCPKAEKGRAVDVDHVILASLCPAEYISRACETVVGFVLSLVKLCVFAEDIITTPT